MNLFHRYIIKHVLFFSLLVISIMIALVFLVTFLGEFQDIGKGDYHFFQAFIYVLLRLPHNIYLFSPMLILLGGILGLGVLTTHQELMVIRSSGFSLSDILKSILYSALLLVVLITSLGEGIAPLLDHQAAIRKQNAEKGGQVLATTSGLWLHVGNNFLHVDRVLGQHHLEGVTRYEFDPKHQLMASYHVDSMDFKDKEWFLNEVVKTIFMNSNETQAIHIDHDVWQLTLNPSLLTVGIVEPEEMSLAHLNEFSRHLSDNGLSAAPFKLAFWQRVLQPFSIIIMLFLAVPFVLNIPRSTSLGLRILFGIILGFVFYLLNAMIGQLSIVFQFPPLLAAIIPILMFSFLAYCIFQRV